jgi:5-bromo-4-chloroindolyl phosphate hydrolysis protein
MFFSKKIKSVILTYALVFLALFILFYISMFLQKANELEGFYTPCNGTCKEDWDCSENTICRDGKCCLK